MATADMEVGVMLPDSTRIICTHVYLPCVSKAVRKIDSRNVSEKMLSTSDFGYSHRGITAAWHCCVTAGQ